MDYKTKLLELVKDLNALGSDRLLFCNRDKWGEFKVDIKEGLINEDGIEKDAVDVLVSFSDGEIIHPIIRKKFTYKDNEYENTFFAQLYSQFFMYGILGVDSVGRGIDSETGININFLTFSTILNEGLEKLKTK